MKKGIKSFKNAKEFGSYLGLSDIEMELVKYKKTIIEKLKKARLAQEISQANLAKMVDSKQPSIARMESGLVSEVSLDFLAKVAYVLGMSFTLSKKKAA